MNCRKNIKGLKTWVDNDNLNKTRPTEPITVNLLRDGKKYRTTKINSAGDGKYGFFCLPVWKNAQEQFLYSIEEVPVEGYQTSIDGYNITNTLIIPAPYEVTLQRATAVLSPYMTAPNTWALHGGSTADLYITDRILIALEPATAPLTVKWEYGIRDTDYFRQGGGIDITSTFLQGFPISLNSDYTVYVLGNNGADTTASITIDRIRDGSALLPYLLIDFQTAQALDPSVYGIGQFSMYFMRGGGEKLLKHYEIYEDIEMLGKTWQPVGIMEDGFSGTLYGNGHKINNFSLSGAASNSGLFTKLIGNAEIQSLSLTNCNITGIEGIISGFTANIFSENNGSVLLKNLSFQGTVQNLGNVGSSSAIVGFARIESGSSLIIDSCNVDAVITSDIAAAGVLSDSETLSNGSILINNCHTVGSVTASGSQGGIVAGIAASCDVKEGPFAITNCSNGMAVHADDFMAGGILGYTHTNNTVLISSCLNKGSVEAARPAGGLIGNYSNNAGYDGTLTVRDCYNTGSVTQLDKGATGMGAGGLVGSIYGKCLITNSYNAANVVSLVDKSGGISSDAPKTTVENCAAVCELVSATNNVNRVGRITSYKSADTVLNNNVAYVNMQTLINGVQKTPLDIGGASLDGLTTPLSTIKTQSLYEDVLGWDFTNVWSFKNGAYTLPILRGIPSSLQPADLPSHLI